MFTANVYKERRDILRRKVGSGLIILLGNNESPANYPDNCYKFRQDSSFLYFFGLDKPGLVGVLDTESGKDYLFGDDFTIDDIIWMGPQPGIQEQAQSVGVANSAPLAEAQKTIEQAIAKGQRIHFLPPYRGDNKLFLEELTGIRSAMQKSYVSIELIKAIVAQRSVKSNAEIEEIERACDIGYEMHTMAMRLCKPGVKEQYITGMIEGIALAHGAGAAFPTILSMHGETLHNHYHGNILEAGRLMITDAGAEAESHYSSDFTRTIPVGGKFSECQKNIYNIVAKCHDKAIEFAHPGTTWKQVHIEVCRVLAQGLKELGLMKGDIHEAVDAGAHALFMPHGLGHMMGLDVHDMEDIGQNYVGFDDEVRPSSQFGLSSLRMGRRLEAGFVMTGEPGCYFIPDLINQWKANGTNKDFLCFEEIEKYKNFGGIRLEDDILITSNGSRFLGKKRIPIYVDDIEAIMNE